MTQFEFSTRPFSECVGLFRELDRKCFPKEMREQGAEDEEILKSKAQAIVAIVNGKEVGLTVLIQDSQAVALLEKNDRYFTPHPKGMYSYSEAISPEHQSTGLGKAMIKEITTVLRRQGFESLSAHVRTVNGWDRGRENHLKVVESRTITDFWQDPQEIVRFQAAQI